MKKLTYILFSLAFTLNAYSQKNCDEAFSAASYTVAHTTNSYEANNVDHTQEWAMKALETFEEVEEITSECGCETASNFAYEGIVAVEKCLDNTTYERARFYAKRSREKAKLMIDALAKCSNTSIDRINNNQSSDNSYASSSDSIDDYTSNSDEEDLLAQQRELEAQQKELQRKIEEKKMAEIALKQEKQAELQKQIKVKSNAEEALSVIEAGYTKLAQSIGCQKAYLAAKNNYIKTKADLEDMTLSETKLHYTVMLNEIAEKAMLHFLNCAEDIDEQ